MDAKPLPPSARSHPLPLHQPIVAVARPVKSSPPSTPSTRLPADTAALQQSPPTAHSSSSQGHGQQPDRDAAAPTTTPRHAPLRAPDPAKRVTTGKNDALRDAIDRHAVREQLHTQQQSQHHSPQNTPSYHSRQAAQPAVPAAAPHASPPASPKTMSTSSAASRQPAAAAAAAAAAAPLMAHRTASIDSTVSTLSSTSQRPNGGNSYRVSESATPQDVAAFISAAGSADAAVQKLLTEKQQAASHNAQLWRLVEKQRAMILGLNKDLEKALKEKERYRRKLKEQLAQSTSAPALITSTGRADGLDSQDASSSSSHVGQPSDASRDISVDTRKTSDASEVLSAIAGRSDTPQDAPYGTSSALPATPQSADSIKSGQRELDRAEVTPVAPQGPFDAKPAIATVQHAPKTHTPPMSPKLVTVSQSSHGHQKSMSNSSAQQSPPPSAVSMSSPKTRKAPPAPLKLDASRSDPAVANNIIDASDSEYEQDPESARSEYIERGRRKTREDDDRERVVLARQEEEQRSKSETGKKSNSRPTEPMQAAAPHRHPSRGASRQQPVFEPTANPTELLRSRAVSGATEMLQRNNTAPSLMSPGLPMSPRPGDRPPNSPMPRAPTAATISIPMSPKHGLPLSPRAPRQAIPLPPQTPMSSMSPHLDRVKNYNLHPGSISTIADRLKPTSAAGDAEERASISTTDTAAASPGEIYLGLMTDEYPGLLLPPNALPSIFVKTSSSRMKPSRASFIAPKTADENPVFTLAVFSRSDMRQLWRVEKTYHALASLDQNVKGLVTVRDRLPEKQLFAGHSPAKIDARRMALNHYFERMLDSVTNEKAALVVCKFLSTDTVGGEGSDYFNNSTTTLDGRPDSPLTKLRPNMAGYLTKRGKNFGGWKARYFVLDGPNLKYFESRGGAQSGSIKLQNAQIGKQSTNASAHQEDEENQFRHAFLILEPKKKDSTSLVRHVLCAESDEERDAWVEALLQYVDYKDDEEPQPGRQAQVSKYEISGPRSPRLQKSMTDLRAESKSSIGSTTSRSIDQVRTVNYSETVAGEAPVMVPPSSQSPSPPFEQPASAAPEHPLVHPAISGPTNAQRIQDASDWGMKPPPTPGAKDKKRSMFSNLPFTRGRSSSDLAPENVKSPGYASVSNRGIFGVPLAEAVASAQPDDATTELPAVVYRCIEYLTARNAIAEEGIFRLSGSNTVIRALKDRFNAEGDVNLLADENYYDVHAVASLLKMYLRELPASILTRDLHLDFLKCLEISGDEKVIAINNLVNRLPAANRALLEALSAFMLLVVNNVEANKMNVRNLGVVFSPTLNLPGPLISLLVEEQRTIFGPELVPGESTSVPQETAKQTSPSSTDLRSPRKQIFTDLPTPAYNQTQFQSLGGPHQQDDTGFTPMHPTYAAYHMAPQGDGGFGSLNDALRSPTVYGTTGTGEPTPRDVKARRRESGMLVVNNGMGPAKKTSMSRLREEPSPSF
ncbi:Rho-type GTPase-activating 2 [Lecanosticta acicola]|uniref:Rho-type GTPase-activating 2 n=1 Tax=Lecanosticta acicola TaxID=111012 RepID=A0AAI8Z8Y1_9PEZI|nr:Rho-type GTPase-activating 2 [Lecanosticta acicola]